VEAGCSAYNGNETNCKATGYCWWDTGDSTCDEPTSEWMEDFENEKTNPGCWIFDNQQGRCANVTGCNYNSNMSKCVGLESQGIQCENITDSSFCNKIPVLASCCKWSNNTCQADKTNTKCFEGVQAPPVGATFCEDYNSYSDRATCLKIAGDPWYMPCKWDDTGTADTSDDRCVFRSTEKFGGRQKDFGKITSKKDCEFAGGMWAVEYYCEGNKSVPYGWCEKKFGAESMSCDASCWSCEYQPNGTRWNSEAAARAACKASKLSYCNWTSDSNSPSGFGYCKMPDNIMFSKGDCSSDCKSCESKTSPKSSCESSPAQCKWVTDTSGVTTLGGWCYPKSEKSCSEDCFRCYDEASCANYGEGSKGSCQWDSSTKICKPKNFNKEICFDGTDNDGDTKVDCEDSDCFSDSFCGASMISNCWKYTTQSICTNKSSEGCVWITDPWTDKQWCGRTGENCFLWDNNQTTCGSQSTCQWTSATGGGFCKINDTTTQTCFKLSTESECKANVNCKWIKDVLTGTSSCKFNPMTCDSYAQSSCQNVTYCTWVINPESPTTGNCKSKCLSNMYSIQSSCNADTNCQWLSGFCNPSQQSGMNMEECWRFSNNQTGCDGAPACQWKTPMSGGFCDINETLSMGTCKNMNQTACTSSPNDASCSWMTDPSGLGGWCDLKYFQCGMYQNNQTCTNITAHPGVNCTWSNNHCGPICMNYSSNTTCNAAGPLCSWRSGFCESKMSTQMFQGMDSKPVFLGMDMCPEAGVAGEQDICGFGLKDNSDTFAFGTPVWSMLNSAACNGQQVKISQNSTSTITGSGTNTTKFYWYLDTDGINSGGCTAYNNASMGGFEFFLKYIAKWENGQLKETKMSYRCDSGEWIITDIKLTGYQTLMCNEIGGAMMAVSKSDLSKFSDLYKPEKEMRIYSATGNKITTEINPVETIGPTFYKPGTADFKFEDCRMPGVDMDGDGLKSENDPDCMMFNKLGFIRYEDCFETGIDEDGDGLVDCNDPDCKFAPNCGGKGVNAANYIDTGAPNLLRSEVDTFPDGAFIKYDTDEPANGSVTFYYNSSSCSDSNSSGMNKIIKDPGLLDTDTWNDYKSWHDGPINNFAFNSQRLGYTLTNGTSYYYKIIVCDSSNNCGTSACLNFTTAASSNRKDCPDCDFTIKLTGGNNIKFDFGDTGTYTSLSDSTNACGGTGLKSNYSQASQANVRVEGNSSAITFGNASVIGATGSINITEGTTTSGGYSVGYVGLPSDDFDELADKIRPKTCVIDIPRGASGTCDKVWKCDDSLANCVDATSDSTLLNSTSTTCTWKIPCDFSTYKAGTPTSTSTTTTGGGGGTSGGGGGSGVTVLRSKGNVNISIPSIAKGKSVSINIYKTENVAFRQINISVINTVSKAKIFYKKITTLPTNVEILNNVYHYIEITSENITEDKIHKVEIQFVVDKLWLNENKIDSSTIRLYRWSNDKWIELTTNKVNESYDDVTFRSESPGLSYFAIAGYKEGQAPTGTAIACVENWQCTDWSACADDVRTRTCTDLNSCGTVGNKPEEASECLAKEEVIGALPLIYIIPIIIALIVIIGAAAWKFKIFKTKAVSIILILLIFSTATYFAYKTSSEPTAYEIAQSAPQCERQVPYEVQESYTESEPYTYTYYEDVPLKYKVEQENSFRCNGITSPLGVCLDLTIKNEDSIDGDFQVVGYLERYNGDKFVENEQSIKSQNIKAYDSYKFSFVFDITASESWLYGYDINVPSKSVGKQETRFRDVVKTRTKTEYKTEYGPC
jgi:PGF-pre-PGF domain-containing protein